MVNIFHALIHPTLPFGLTPTGVKQEIIHVLMTLSVQNILVPATCRSRWLQAADDCHEWLNKRTPSQ